MKNSNMASQKASHISTSSQVRLHSSTESHTMHIARKARIGEEYVVSIWLFARDLQSRVPE